MIHEFNLPLLSKQLWRLVQFLDSLIARVLRRKYFKCRMPLRLNKADRPSYGWTSIMAAMMPARLTRPISLVVHPMMRVLLQNSNPFLRRYKLHFICQTISGQLAVTTNLAHRHMRCDDHCPRCGAEDETINHAISECPPCLQTWAHAATPT
ncbi:unnamed protein product, partial [Brassica rapa subsp. trilocularis]